MGLKSRVYNQELDTYCGARTVFNPPFKQTNVKNLLFCFTAFHFMRDHPAHSIEVLGSGWGVRMSQLERNFIDAGFMTAVKDPIFWAPRGAYGPDQGFLKR